MNTIGCVCEQADARYWVFEKEDQYVGSDRRFADVRLRRCRTCGRLWLRYHVEYEHLTASGRWARALISEDDAQHITAATAADYIDAAQWYLYGGSYFGHAGLRGSGPMPWDG